MKVYVLSESVDHPWGVNPLAVYSSKEKAESVYYEKMTQNLEKYINPKEDVKEYVREFELDLDPEL